MPPYFSNGKLTKYFLNLSAIGLNVTSVIVPETTPPKTGIIFAIFLAKVSLVIFIPKKDATFFITL